MKHLVENFLPFFVSRTHSDFAIYIAREILCFKNAFPGLLSSHAEVRTKLAQNFLCWRRSGDVSQKLVVENVIHHLLNLKENVCSIFGSCSSSI